MPLIGSCRYSQLLSTFASFSIYDIFSCQPLASCHCRYFDTYASASHKPLRQIFQPFKIAPTAPDCHVAAIDAGQGQLAAAPLPMPPACMPPPLGRYCRLPRAAASWPGQPLRAIGASRGQAAAFDFQASFQFHYALSCQLRSYGFRH